MGRYIVVVEGSVAETLEADGAYAAYDAQTVEGDLYVRVGQRLTDEEIGAFMMRSAPGPPRYSPIPEGRGGDADV